ncbi:hypothetical protein PF006_g20668 [Phytophthora fragariae]|uniref:Peptidase S33 tripeptidyl aminopeptidase-like C-terminal domain-containing protein n=1 Tax=Phytophthora fragariae TaxID=53985 RepID=A0A6A3S4F5_9STRA|nr:hypothetical protein PF006_g20668 [Phytophthora fragariae]
MRTLIPPVVYRLSRCASEDLDVLTHFSTALNAYLSSPDEENAFESTLLYNLIVFSEMWEKPEPSVAEMLARFTNTSISNGGTYTEIPQYCAFSKENSTVCDQLDVGSYAANGIIYERDEFWNKSAVIASQASILLLSSKLDPQTPHKYAEYLLDALDGDKKELITFSYATHGTLWTTPTVAGDDTSETCGMKLLLSYVSNNGDLGGLDKSCVGEMPAFNLTVPLGYQHYFLSTDDAYDGVYEYKRIHVQQCDQRELQVQNRIHRVPCALCGGGGNYCFLRVPLVQAQARQGGSKNDGGLATAHRDLVTSPADSQVTRDPQK